LAFDAARAPTTLAGAADAARTALFSDEAFGALALRVGWLVVVAPVLFAACESQRSVNVPDTVVEPSDAVSVFVSHWTATSTAWSSVALVGESMTRSK
jgi:hypothetical protein